MREAITKLIDWSSFSVAFAGGSGFYLSASGFKHFNDMHSPVDHWRGRDYHNYTTISLCSA